MGKAVVEGSLGSPPFEKPNIEQVSERTWTKESGFYCSVIDAAIVKLK